MKKNIVIQACYRQVFERDISKAYNLQFNDLESQLKNGQLSIKEFIRSLGKSEIYRKQFYEAFVNSRVVELAFKHFLGRGLSSIEEFQRNFAIISSQGLGGLIDSLINSSEYADYFGEETVPYFRGIGEEPQECRNWGAQIDLFNYSTVFRKIPQFITLFADYTSNLPDQHPYGLSNDPLYIQFGAIFPKNTVNLRKKSAFFGKDTRRILLRRGPGIYSQICKPNLRAKLLGNLGPKIFKLNKNNKIQLINGIQSNIENNIEKVINAIYLRVFGRFVYTEEMVSISRFENQFRDGKMSVRDFIKVLVKSSIFRSLYWQPLYICKAIEYIHNKLIGRPTYGRQEINQYFDIVYKLGYYDMIDAMMNSPEYIESFGDNTVPYERYILSSVIASRNLRQQNIAQPVQQPIIDLKKKNIDNLIVLSDVGIMQKMTQGVTAQRDQAKIFIAKNNITRSEKSQIIRALYRQLFERDLK